MEKELIRERLYQKYIQPTKKEREDYIGIEIEIPIINLKKESVDYGVVQKITKEFMNYFGFRVVGKDDNGDIYAAIDDVSGDILSYDCSYNNLERERIMDLISEIFKILYVFKEKI